MEETEMIDLTRCTFTSDLRSTSYRKMLLKQMCDSIQWYYKDLHRKWVRFPRDLNEELEWAYSADVFDLGRFSQIQIVMCDVIYRINFLNMSMFTKKRTFETPILRKVIKPLQI